MAKPEYKPPQAVPGVNHPIPFETLTYVAGGWVAISGVIMPNGEARITKVSPSDMRAIVNERAKINFAQNILAQERK